METKLADSQDNKITVSYKEIYERIALLPPDRKWFGIPNGGSYVALATGNATTLEHCDNIIDDIIDSGKTKAEWEAKTNKKVYALFNKNTEPKLKGKWVVFPWEVTAEKGIEDTVIRQLQYIGEDANRVELQKTPQRVIKSWSSLFAGYNMSPQEILSTRFPANHHEMVLLRDIEFYSTCEHHMLPFTGRIHLAYIPNGEVVGISKLARLVECYTRRLQIQERLCNQLVNAVMEHLHPTGVACVIKAQHLCMRARGVNKQDSVMVTSAVRGIFDTDINARQEFLQLIHMP